MTANWFGLLVALLTLADCGLSGPPSEIHNWEPVGLSGGGGMFSPAISPADPNLMMINCDMSAAYISEDGGHNWRMIHHAQLRTDTQCRPGCHPSDANIVYASSRGRLKISRDRGRSFTSIGNLRDSLSGQIAVNPSNPNMMLVGTRSGRCSLSRDAGVTWTTCPGPQGRMIGFHFDRTDDGRTMFAATDKSIWRSDDGGQTWAERTDGLPWKEIKGFDGGSDSAGAMLYCTVTSKLEDGVLRGGVYRSRDRGQTWQPAMGRGINVDTTKTDQWSYGSIAQYRQILAADARPLTVYVTNTSTGFHPPHHETVYRSDDGGDTWRATFFQDPRFPQYNVAPNFVTASAGQSYKGAFSNVHDIPNDNIISERHGHNGPGGVCMSRDFGASWKPEAQGLPLRPMTSIVLDPRSPGNARTLYAGVFMEGVYKSTDDGETWKLKKNGLGHPLNMRVSRVILHKDGTLFAMICAKRSARGEPLMSEGVGLYRSRDGAETWEKVNASRLFLYPKDFSVHPRDSNIILVGACDAGGGDQSGGLYETHDGGRTWQRIGRQARQTFGGYFHPKHDEWIYMTLTEGAPGAGLWLSQDNGQTWQAFDDLPFPNIQRVTFDLSDDGLIYVTTFGGSVWRGPAVPRKGGNDE